MGVTLWHFAETPDGSMRRIPTARVHYAESHSWIPAPDQLDEVAAAVNAAAERAPVVVVVGGALTGV